MSDLPEHARRNRDEWASWAPDYAQEAPGAWAAEEITWGVWNVPDAELRLLPESVDGLEVIEPGCGTAYISAWLARRGARPVGVDITPAQLATARAMQERFGMHRFQWEQSAAVEFHLGYGDWIRLLRSSGLEVVDLAELQAPESGPEHRFPGLPERWWARQWPSEQIWRARKR